MLDKWRQRSQSIPRVQAALLLGQLVHFLMPLGIGQSYQRDFVSQSCESQGEERGLLDPVMKCREEKNVLTRRRFFNKRFDPCHRARQRRLQTQKIIVILAGAILLAECVIQLGGERQFANEIAEGGFVEHIVLATETTELFENS